MKVVCDNCGAVYKIPEHKLVKEVNKATCRKCGHRIMIRRKAPVPDAEAESGEAATVIAEAAKVGAEKPAAPVADPHPPFGTAPEEPTPLPTSPMDRAAPPHPAQPAAPTPMPMPTPGAGYSHQPTPAPAPSPAATGVPLTERAHDTTGDMSLVLLGAAGTGAGAIVLALGGAHFLAHFAGLFLALWGTLLIALIVVTGLFGRRRAWVFTSLFLSLLLSGVLSIPLNPLAIQLVTGEVSFGDIDTLAQRVSNAAQQVQQIQPEANDGVAVVEPDATLVPEPDATLVPIDRTEPDATHVPEPEDGTPQDLLDVLATEEPEPIDRTEPDATHVPEPAPATTSSRSGSSSSRSGSSSSGSSSSRSGSSSSGTSSSGTSSSSSSSSRTPTSSSSSSSSSPSSSSSSSGSGQKTIPTTVIDIQIRNNKNIKACFLAHKKSTGELPSVTLRFTLEPDGSVSSASLREAAYQNTALESCLSGSIKMIDFQEFDGPAYTLNYPFRF